MRVADRTTARNYLKYLDKAKSDYAKTNERVAAGHRLERLSEDVSAGSRVLRVRTEKYKAEKQLDNVKAINDELTTTESAMTSINDLLTLVSTEKIQKAKTGTSGDSGREALANEVKNIRDEILQFANTRYGQKYVFGGTNVSSAPFSLDKTTGKLLYNGIDVDSIQKEDGEYGYIDADGNRQSIPMDDDVYMDIGLGIKMSGPNVDPNTGFLVSYSGLDIMGWGTDADGASNNIINMLTVVEENIRHYDKDQLDKADTKLTKLMDSFHANLTNIGSKTSFLDTVQTRLATTVDSHQVRISNLMGVNDAEEATNQTMNDYVLKAVIQMGSRILPVSLMDFLK